jgi:hypothetical protein
MRVKIDLTGHVYGRLTVLGRAPRTKGRECWRCQCKCGNVTATRVDRLISGNTKSCGCFRRERMTTHGKSQTKAFLAWQNMWRRCTNPNTDGYHRYGGRGITVCKRWKNFALFLKDIGEFSKGDTLDRIDNNKGYSPGNCRRVSNSENCQNTCASKFWFVDGVRYDSLLQAAETLGVNYRTIWSWCNGYVHSGKRHPPKKNCWSKLKYGA